MFFLDGRFGSNFRGRTMNLLTYIFVIWNVIPAIFWPHDVILTTHCHANLISSAQVRLLCQIT